MSNQELFFARQNLVWNMEKYILIILIVITIICCIAELTEWIKNRGDKNESKSKFS